MSYIYVHVEVLISQELDVHMHTYFMVIKQFDLAIKNLLLPSHNGATLPLRRGTSTYAIVRLN